MSDNSTNLQLPYLQASQAQKHVTVNGGIQLLDAYVMLAIEDKDLTAPPGSPADGSRYIPASGATGAWTAWDFNIAYYVNGAWNKIVPREGFLAYVRDEDIFYVYNGTAWNAFTTSSTTTLTGDVTGSGAGTFATTIGNNAVSNAKLRDSAALSVIGNATNATADPADIAAGTDGQVLRRSGTSLGFGTVATAGLAANAADNTIIRDSAALSVIGNSTNATADPADIAAGTDGQVLRRSGTTLGFGSIVVSALPGGVMPTFDIAFQCNAGSTITWTSMPSAATNFNGQSRTIAKADLTNYTQARLFVNMQGTAGSASAILSLKYATSNTYTAGSYSDIGASAVSCAINVANQIADSGWINLASGAKADVYLNVVGSGGDGATSPTFGALHAQFR